MPGTHVQIAVVGAGFGGLGAAIRLTGQGYERIAVFERADALGGTWRDNSYPGCACDVPSHMYSFSFAPNPDWSRTFSPQPEIWAYLERCADRFDVRRHIRFGHDVREAAWDEAAGHWRIDTSRGPYTADVLISASGPFTEPAVPKLAGLETFTGTVFHSARWRHDLDLTGRSVAVVGTGASAIQFVPEIQPKAGRLRVFQRTPPWVLPRRERAISPVRQRLYRRLPAVQRLARTGIYWMRELWAVGFLNPPVMRLANGAARKHLARSVPDPCLRAKLTPDFLMGCKRVLMSNTYYPALQRDNVDVITDPIREVRPQGIVTADGVEHPVDTIIFGTGFHVTDIAIGERIHGRDGRTLAEVWAGSARAYRGTTVAGFPNLFLLLGPNTGLGHNSVVFMAEAQIEYVVRALKHMRRTGARAIAPTEAAQAADVERIDERMAGTVWSAGGCRSWYIDATGRNSTLWPGHTFTYRQRMRRFDPAAYEVSR